LKLKIDKPLSNFAFNFNFRRYMVVAWRSVDPMVNIYIINDILVAKGRA